MKTYELKIAFMEDTNQLHIEAENNGFSSMELIALFEMRKNDILAQIAPDMHFKRIFVDGDGTKSEIKEENE